MALREAVERHEAEVVAVPGVLRPRVAEADDYPRWTGHVDRGWPADQPPEGIPNAAKGAHLGLDPRGHGSYAAWVLVSDSRSSSQAGTFSVAASGRGSSPA